MFSKSSSLKSIFEKLYGLVWTIGLTYRRNKAAFSDFPGVTDVDGRVNCSRLSCLSRSANLSLRSDVALKTRKHEFALCYTADLKDTKPILLSKL